MRDALKLEKLVSGNVYVSADFHYGHVGYCSGTSDWIERKGYTVEDMRDFPTLELYNEALIDGINATVGRNDLLISLGDFAFGGHEGNVKLNVFKFRSAIRCMNMLFFRGNHDPWMDIYDTKSEALRDQLVEMGELTRFYTDLTCTYKSRLMHLYHHPISDWNKKRKDSIHLHGHQHNSVQDRITGRLRMDIGIDGSPTFTPYRLDEVIELLDNHANQYEITTPITLQA